MADFERNLERPEACVGAGSNHAKLYRSRGNVYRSPLRLDLGAKPVPLGDPRETFQWLERVHGDSLPIGIVAVDLFHLCNQAHPDIRERGRAGMAVLERLGAIVMANMERVRPFPGTTNLAAPQPNEPDIRRTQRLFEDIRQGTAVQELATTPFERAHRPIIAVVEATGSKPHGEIFVAIRGNYQQFLSPEEL